MHVCAKPQCLPRPTLILNLKLHLKERATRQNVTASQIFSQSETNNNSFWFHFCEHGSAFVKDEFTTQSFSLPHSLFVFFRNRTLSCFLFQFCRIQIWPLLHIQPSFMFRMHMRHPAGSSYVSPQGF